MSSMLVGKTDLLKPQTPPRKTKNSDLTNVKTADAVTPFFTQGGPSGLASPARSHAFPSGAPAAAASPMGLPCAAVPAPPLALLLSPVKAAPLTVHPGYMSPARPPASPSRAPAAAVSPMGLPCAAVPTLPLALLLSPVKAPPVTAHPGYMSPARPPASSSRAPAAAVSPMGLPFAAVPAPASTLCLSPAKAATSTPSGYMSPTRPLAPPSGTPAATASPPSKLDFSVLGQPWIANRGKPTPETPRRPSSRVHGGKPQPRVVSCNFPTLFPQSGASAAAASTPSLFAAEEPFPSFFGLSTGPHTFPVGQKFRSLVKQFLEKNTFTFNKQTLQIDSLIGKGDFLIAFGIKGRSDLIVKTLNEDSLRCSSQTIETYLKSQTILYKSLESLGSLVRIAKILNLETAATDGFFVQERATPWVPSWGPNVASLSQLSVKEQLHLQTVKNWMKLAYEKGTKLCLDIKLANIGLIGDELVLFDFMQEDWDDQEFATGLKEALGRFANPSGQLGQDCPFISQYLDPRLSNTNYQK
jgi:hypothetical protein